MYELRRKPHPTFLPTKAIFNLPYHIGMVWEELAIDDTVSDTQWRNRYSTVKCYANDWVLYPCTQCHQPILLTSWAISPPQAEIDDYVGNATVRTLTVERSPRKVWTNSLEE